MSAKMPTNHKDFYLYRFGDCWILLSWRLKENKFLYSFAVYETQTQTTQAPLFFPSIFSSLLHSRVGFSGKIFIVHRHTFCIMILCWIFESKIASTETVWVRKKKEISLKSVVLFTFTCKQPIADLISLVVLQNWVASRLSCTSCRNAVKLQTE